MRTGTRLFICLLLFPSLPAAAQHQHEQLGHVTFPVSCAPEAARRFERAMGLLHSFWWEEGERAFQAVLDADSTCAMAHWGLAMNAWGNPFAGGPVAAGLAAGAAHAEPAAGPGASTASERRLL